MLYIFNDNYYHMGRLTARQLRRLVRKHGRLVEVSAY